MCVLFREAYILYSVLIFNMNFTRTTVLLPFAHQGENNIDFLFVYVCKIPQEKRVNLERNENANLHLPCRPVLSVNITILHTAPTKTAHNHLRCYWYKSLCHSSLHHSLDINQSPLLLCFLLLSILYLSIDFCHPSACLVVSSLSLLTVASLLCQSKTFLSNDTKKLK